MAYEDMEYEVILDRMLERVVEQYPNLDAREGSIIYNALAPAALELAIMYVELDNVLNESFVKTASREYVLLKCEEVGIDISIFDATKGAHKAEFNVEVSIGSRWNCDLYNYEVVEYLGSVNGLHQYKVICETEGSEANKLIGDLTPIDELPTGLDYAMLLECLIEGEDESTDEHIKEVYFNQVKNDGTNGNIAQYEEWCESFPGIGGYKIIPLWSGDGTVKVSILNGTNGIASDTLINDFQNYLDPGATGMGDGVAPIGAAVTVTTATEKPLTITANVKLKTGYSDTSVITEAVTNYFSQIAYKQDTISYMQVGATILNCDAVEDVTMLRINNDTVDVKLKSEEIPILKTYAWYEVE